MRLLNYFKSQDHTREAHHVVSCMNQHIHLFLKASKSRANVLKLLKTTLLVRDFGASFELTPFHAEFIDYVECDIDFKDISKLNKVNGFGTTLQNHTATNNDLLYIPAFSYHLPSADICFFSPQAYYQLYGGSSELDSNKVVISQATA